MHPLRQNPKVIEDFVLVVGFSLDPLHHELIDAHNHLLEVANEVCKEPWLFSFNNLIVEYKDPS